MTHKYLVIVQRNGNEITGHFNSLDRMNKYVDDAIKHGHPYQVFNNVTENFQYQKGLKESGA